MIEPTPEEIQAAIKVFDDASAAYPLEADTQLRGILKAVRTILRTEENASILDRVCTVMRRYDEMARELGRDFK